VELLLPPLLWLVTHKNLSFKTVSASSGITHHGFFAKM
jgi:hypothetical protein